MTSASCLQDDPLAEICELLALGLMRLKARQSTGKSAFSGESSLDCTADQSTGANHSRQSEGQGGEGANSEKGRGGVKGDRASLGREARPNSGAPRKGQRSEERRRSATSEEHEGGARADLPA
jgi:hypothetical protein